MPNRSSLTDLSVRSAKPPAKGSITLWDSTVRGLGLRLSQGGTKTFIVMLRQDRSRIRIGHYPQWKVKEARDEAIRIIADRAGKPRPKRVSLEQAFEIFKQTRTSQYRPTVRRETERTITNYLIRRFGKRAIGDITTDDLTGITDKLMDKPGTCQHVYAASRLLFRWAVKRRLIDRSPLEGIGMPVSIPPRDRVLTDAELRLVYQRAAMADTAGGNIVRLLILTGQRRGEIAGLRGEWIDRTVKTITYPAGFTKNGRRHTIPYGEMVAALIDDTAREGLLFPARGSNGDRAYNGWSKLKVSINPEIENWTLHDLRRTFATNLAGLGVAPHIIERLLNHVSGTISGVAAIYNRFSYREEMWTAMQQYETWLQTLLSNTESTNGRDVPRLHGERAGAAA